MQDFHSIPGLAGRIFGTVAGAADHRRIRGYPGVGGGAIPEPPAKCPRCESTNTKFCYYNNYNLSQPRHFCKSCRRYWTKGGVLRNVPVGGGCRKSSSSKRSSTSKKSPSKDRRRSSTAESSSDSSSLTAATEAVFAPPASDDFDPVAAEQQAVFPEAGTFTGLMAVASASVPAFLGLDFSDHPLPAGAVDVRAPAPLIDPAGMTMEWPAAMDPALFDLAGAGDSGGYWNQGGGHWVDTEPNLYLP